MNASTSFKSRLIFNKIKYVACDKVLIVENSLLLDFWKSRQYLYIKQEHSKKFMIYNVLPCIAAFHSFHIFLGNFLRYSIELYSLQGQEKCETFTINKQFMLINIDQLYGNFLEGKKSAIFLFSFPIQIFFQGATRR